MTRYELRAVIRLEVSDDRAELDERIAIVTEAALSDPSILALQLVDRVAESREAIPIPRPAM